MLRQRWIWRGFCWVVLGFALILRACAAFTKPLDVVLVVDESGSMYGWGPVSPQDPAFFRYTAVQYVLRKMLPDDRLAVVAFGSGAPELEMCGLRPVADLGVGYPSDLGAIAVKRGLGSTNYEAALLRASEILRAPAAGRERLVFFLTDGRQTDGDPNQALAWAKGIRESQDARICVVGLGTDTDPEVLRRIATEGGSGRVFFARSPADLPTIFSSAFRDLAGRETTVAIDPREKTFEVGEGASHLRAIVITDARGVDVRLQDPRGRAFEVRPDPPIYEGQTARVAALRVPEPTPGTWKILRASGGLEISYESDFRARIESPADGSVLAAKTPTPFRVRVESRSGSKGPFAVKLQFTPEAPQAEKWTVDLKAAPSGLFEGTIADFRAPGRLRVDAFVTRTGKSGGTEPGIPANALYTITPQPQVVITWPKETRYEPRSGTVEFRVEAESSSPRAETVRIDPGGAVRSVSPASFVVPAGGRASQIVRVDTSKEPGLYPCTVTPNLVQSDVEFVGSPYRFDAKVKTWMERNGWWFWSLIGLIGLLLLLILLLLLWRAMNERRWRLLYSEELRRVKITSDLSDEERSPAELANIRRPQVTLGGGDADLPFTRPDGLSTWFQGPVAALKPKRGPRGTCLLAVTGAGTGALKNAQGQIIARHGLRRNMATDLTVADESGVNHRFRFLWQSGVSRLGWLQQNSWWIGPVFFGLAFLTLGWFAFDFIRSLGAKPAAPKL
ncbi:MAG TPA: vWA domain-containing protein [Fimbriimonadaceae bacterium]|nr:vWA domain-containing protein [Fimbriimonadaceae bacterium]